MFMFVQGLASGYPFKGASVSLTCAHHSLSTFLNIVAQDTAEFSYTLTALIMESAISTGSPDSCQWRAIFRNRDDGNSLSVFFVFGVSGTGTMGVGCFCSLFLGCHGV